MKKVLLSVFLPIFSLLSAQDHQMNTLQEAEAKSALSRMQFQSNANTGNYDVKYHRLELEVNPSVAQISGHVTTYFEAKSPLDQITFDLSAFGRLPL